MRKQETKETKAKSPECDSLIIMELSYVIVTYSTAQQLFAFCLSYNALIIVLAPHGILIRVRARASRFDLNLNKSRSNMMSNSTRGLGLGFD